jgi:hypothetical protein
MAAQEAGQKVAKLAKDEGNEDLVGTLERMRAQAAETAERGTEVASSFEGKKTAILDEARDVKSKAQQMMKTYLDEASDTLDGFEFLTMPRQARSGTGRSWRRSTSAREPRRVRARRLGSPDPAAAPPDRPLNLASARRRRKPNATAE